jgi:DNA-repair protein XRCC2
VILPPSARASTCAWTESSTLQTVSSTRSPLSRSSTYAAISLPTPHGLMNSNSCSHPFATKVRFLIVFIIAALMFCSAGPPGCTQIPALDAYFLSAYRHKPSLSSFNAGDVIEIQGPAASGKTHLLYHLIITCILPSFHASSHIGGWEKRAIVFDTDGTFHVRRLRTLLLARLDRLLHLNSNEENAALVIEELVDEALQKVHIFHPNSSAQLAATLTYLPVYQTVHFRDVGIGFLCVDSISSFYWPDRFTDEQMRPAAVPVSNTTISWVPTLQHVLLALHNFRLSHGPVTVLTNWGLNPLTKSSVDANIYYKQHLHPFPLLSVQTAPPFDVLTSDTNISSTNGNVFDLTHHITLQVVPPLPLYPSIPLETTSEEGEFRKQVAERSEIMGVVRTSGTTSVGTFIFCITDQEILV